MKKNLSYYALKDLAVEVSHKLQVQYAKEIAENRLFLFAIARGGLTFGHLVAYRMALPLGVVFPMNDYVQRLHPQINPYDEPGPAVYVYLEDVIAEGRTYRQIKDWHETICADEEAFVFVPAVIDANAPVDIQADVLVYGTKTSDWLVFPHEDAEHVTEGDRGLFREGTSNNATAL